MLQPGFETIQRILQNDISLKVESGQGTCVGFSQATNNVMYQVDTCN